MAYPIIDASAWAVDSSETGGKKAKAWLVEPAASDLWLFRFPKEPGEAWAEKIAEQVAVALRLPHARYELATFQGVTGAMTQNFTGRTQTPHGTISRKPFHAGNVLLQRIDPTYEKDVVRTDQHHLERILAVLNHRGLGLRPPIGLDLPWIAAAGDAFIGYLLLDVLIGNTDRHHENWGIQVESTKSGIWFGLAPTFDHASCLGRNVPEPERDLLLARPGGIDQYCRRGASRIFLRNGTKLRVRDVFTEACKLRPGIGPRWQQHLDRTPAQDLLATVDPIPEHLMSTSAKQFCRSMLDCNRSYLLSLQLP